MSIHSFLLIQARALAADGVEIYAIGTDVLYKVRLFRV